MSIAWLVWYALVTSAGAFPGLNLPQRADTVSIRGQENEMLRAYFFDPQNEGRRLDSEIERVLVRALPEVYRRGCDDMIGYWGEMARSTARMSVRSLFRSAADSVTPLQVLLAYRCYSAHPEYRDRFYDERLAVWTLDGEASRLSLVAHGPDCDNCSELSRLDFTEVMQVPPGRVVSVTCLVSSDNPCCDGPTAYTEEKVLYYLLTGAGAKEAGSILKRRKEDQHDDVEGDSSRLYEARITVQRDGAGQVTSIVSAYVEKEDNKAVKQGKLTYVWNPSRQRFAESGR